MWRLLLRASLPQHAASGGPPLTGPPTQRGFGTTLIERTVAHEFDAEVMISREFLRSGLRCTIDLPLTDEIGDAAPSGDWEGEAR
jgi:two-component sensor histidine kinase